MTYEYHWPEKGSKLFTSDAPDWQFSACVNWLTQSPSNWHLYATGYRYGARALLDQLLETTFHRDTLVYPIIFLYRQAIELWLKCILKRGAELFDDAGVEDLGHREIDKLWVACRKLLERMQDSLPDEIETIQANIIEFSDLDKRSFAFRYPTTKQGQPSLREDLRDVNLRHFGEVAEGVVNFLDAVDTDIQVRVDAMSEMMHG